MKLALGLPNNKTVIRDGLDELSLALMNGVIVNIELANKIYKTKRCKTAKKYETLIESYHGGECETIDFQQPELAAKTINEWMMDKTNGKVKDFIQRDALSSKARLVLVNAIFLSGAWEKQLVPPPQNKTEDFYINDDECVPVEMMTSTWGLYGYAESKSLGAKIAQLTFQSHRMSMLIILPKRIGRLQKLMNKMDNRTLDYINKKLKLSILKLSLPKFTFERNTAWQGLLVQLGLKSVFKHGDFSDVCPIAHKIDKLTHKTVIEIQEKGARAMSGSGGMNRELANSKDHGLTPVENSLTGYTPRRQVFKANHPFLFIIQEEGTKAVLFMGVVNNPCDITS